MTVIDQIERLSNRWRTAQRPKLFVAFRGVLHQRKGEGQKLVNIELVESESQEEKSHQIQLLGGVESTMDAIPRICFVVDTFSRMDLFRRLEQLHSQL